MAEGRCPFCKLTTLSTENRDLFGQTFRKHGLTVHQYCLYFAAGLLQRGQDNEGIYGFLLADIRKEVARAKKLTCRFCGLKGAATGCAIGSCQQKCHTPCGLKNGFLLRHYEQFDAYCPVHRRFQNPTLVSAALDKTKSCCICLQDGIQSDFQHDQLSILVCPVCQTGFHRVCLQKRAWLVSNKCFNCVVCTNKNKHGKEMLQMGLEIPEKETEFNGQNEESECGAMNCLCPDGRSFYTRMSKYRLKTCRICDKALGHMVCIKGKLCTNCIGPVTSSPPSSSSSRMIPTSERSVVDKHLNDGVGVAKEARNATSPNKCDCVICRTRQLTPESPTSPVENSIQPPSPSTHTQPSPPTSPAISQQSTLNKNLLNHSLSSNLHRPPISHNQYSLPNVTAMSVKPSTPLALVFLTPSLTVSISLNDLSHSIKSTPSFQPRPLIAPPPMPLAQMRLLHYVSPNTSSGQQQPPTQRSHHCDLPSPQQVITVPFVSPPSQPSQLSNTTHSLSLSPNNLTTSPQSVSTSEKTTPLSNDSSSVCSYFDYIDMPRIIPKRNKKKSSNKITEKDRIAYKFLQKRGLKLKTLRLVLHRVNNIY